MLEAFISKLYLVDPDLLIAHNLCGGMLEVLLARIQFLKISHWSRIGRFKRTQIPNRKVDGGFGGSNWIPRQVTCGRLLVDTFLTAKELIRETNYDMTHLVKV
jgi:DNA polymerase alpha subunit A